METNRVETKKTEIKRTESDLKLINMESVEVEQIEWLFYPFIPFGKVTIIQGDPGEGKTTMVLQIIAKLTKGEKILPEQQQATDEKDRAEKNVDSDANPVESPIEPVNVIYQTAEDGLGDTIKPRLLAAGADCSRVMVIDDNDRALTMMDARLEEAIIQTKARLVVLDPIQGFLGAEVDMHRANEIRPLMKRVAVLAEKYHCAIILIGHMNKNSNGKSSYRGLGSIDFQAAARSVLIVGRIKDEPEIRVVCHVKSSLAPEGKSIAFRLDKDTGFEWIGEYDISADDLLSGDSRGQKSRKPLFIQMKNKIAAMAAQVKELTKEVEKWKNKYQKTKQAYNSVQKELDDMRKDNQKLLEEKNMLQSVSDRYDRVVRVMGIDTVEAAVLQDIHNQKALEEKRRMEQMPKGSIYERLAWGAKKSEMENQQRKKNKTKNRGMEI